MNMSSWFLVISGLLLAGGSPPRVPRVAVEDVRVEASSNAADAKSFVTGAYRWCSDAGDEKQELRLHLGGVTLSRLVLGNAARGFEDPEGDTRFIEIRVNGKMHDRVKAPQGSASATVSLPSGPIRELSLRAQGSGAGCIGHLSFSRNRSATSVFLVTGLSAKQRESLAEAISGIQSAAKACDGKAVLRLAGGRLAHTITFPDESASDYAAGLRKIEQSYDDPVAVTALCKKKWGDGNELEVVQLDGRTRLSVGRADFHLVPADDGWRIEKLNENRGYGQTPPEEYERGRPIR